MRVKAVDGRGGSGVAGRAGCVAWPGTAPGADASAGTVAVTATSTTPWPSMTKLTFFVSRSPRCDSLGFSVITASAVPPGAIGSVGQVEVVQAQLPAAVTTRAGSLPVLRRMTGMDRSEPIGIEPKSSAAGSTTTMMAATCRQIHRRSRRTRMEGGYRTGPCALWSIQRCRFDEVGEEVECPVLRKRP